MLTPHGIDPLARPRLLFLGADAVESRRRGRKIAATTRTRITCRNNAVERTIIRVLEESNQRLLKRGPNDLMGNLFDYGSAFVLATDEASVIEMALVWYSAEFYPVGRKMAVNKIYRDIFKHAGVDLKDVSSTNWIRDDT